MTNFSLEEVTAENLDAVLAMPLRPGQDRFVAPVARSIADAYVTPTAWPRVVIADGVVVGFIMGNFDPSNEVSAFRAGIWRLNVHADYQGTGAGRFAVEQLLDEARRRDVSRITVLWLPGERGPEGFYRKLGFIPTGEVMDGEIVAALDL